MKITRIAVLLLLAMASAFSGAALRVRTFVDPKPQTIRESISFTEASGTINILLIGVDDVEGGKRADAIAFSMVDIDRKKVQVMSIPRDTRVQIRDRGWEKIAHAFAYGGVELLRETVVNLLGMPVNYYVLVNYDTFPSIVDLLGGVEVDVEKHMVYNDHAGKLFINIPKGFQKLDGKNALHYVRFRHDALGDIGRVKRQQEFIRAVLEKLQKPSMITRIPELARKTIEMVNSDMTPAQAIQLASYLGDLPSGNLRFFTLPGKAAYIDNLSYWIGDITAASEALTSHEDEKAAQAAEREPQGEDGGKTAPTERMDLQKTVAAVTTPVAVLNGTDVPGLGKTAATAFQKIGVDVNHVGNAKHSDYRSTVVQYPEKAAEAVRRTALALGELAGVEKRLIKANASVTYATIVFGKDKDKVLKRLEDLSSSNR